MEIVTRKQARERNLNKYFTGVPCTNGHVAERYVTSGACQGCISEAVSGVRRAASAAVAPNPERLAQLEGLVTIRLRAHPLDEATLLDTAAALTVQRRQALVATDVVGARKGTKPEGGTLLYSVNVDAADVQLLRDMQNAMLTARGPNMEAVRAQVFGGAMAQAEAARDNGEGEWKFT
jgi:hypothetical protein